ncbi:MAG: Asp-tRNA(Asn)/Glu-tRNA(Gln) amidotransferase subunit GatA [Parcubacteria group bacterium]|nr:Asp-tRNA(Asn)/Glu-tRNA(Gln) amidotransferase subunit GatA [Parcubacteria group bacterium]
MELKNFTISRAHELLKSREVSSVELTRAFLGEIEKKDKDIHAFLSVHSEYALAQAEEVDKKIARGEELGLLAGVPCAIKDNILVDGLPATAASKILKSYRATYDATVVSYLKKEGAVILGKTNLDEFAMGSSTENSAFGPTRNPHDHERVPGGSSGGSAAAVAAGECLWALGSDTGGSVRQPAGFCGVYGLKPTYGAVSRYGLIAMASSLDQIGPFARSVEDIATIFEAIAGPDPYDSTSSPVGDYRGLSEVANWKLKIENLRIGVPKEYFVTGLDPKVEEVVRKAITQFESLGAEVTEISLPHTPYALACYYIVMPAEISANLARYDGIKYGLSKTENRKSKKEGLQELYFETRGEGFGDEVRRRVMLGTYVLSTGYYDAYYAKAQKVRRLIRNDFENVLNEVDVILVPTSPTLPFKVGERTDDPLAMYLADVYTVSMNLAGVPALSIPCGSVGGLPVGLQIVGKHFDEKTVLQVAYMYEKANQKS